MRIVKRLSIQSVLSLQCVSITMKDIMACIAHLQGVDTGGYPVRIPLYLNLPLCSKHYLPERTSYFAVCAIEGILHLKKGTSHSADAFLEKEIILIFLLDICIFINPLLS